MFRILLLATAALVTPPVAAVSQTMPAAPAASPFDGADGNRDGKISRAEFLAARSSRFDRIDANHDGVINRADFPRAANHQQALAKIDAHIASADADHDGAISRAELSRASTPFFDKADANRDGFITRPEVETLRAASRPRPK